ncbi:hypothetical protein NUSPORA_01526 [Nucleospora cyclopteri]
MSENDVNKTDSFITNSTTVIEIYNENNPIANALINYWERNFDINWEKLTKNIRK